MEAWEEARDVQGNGLSVRVAQAAHPAAQFAHLVFGVVFAGHDERRELHVGSLHGLLDEGHDHRAIAAQDIFIIAIGKALQVDVHRVDEGL